MNLQFDLQNLINTVWPIAGVSAGFALGFAILSMVMSSLRGAIEFDKPTIHKPVVTCPEPVELYVPAAIERELRKMERPQPPANDGRCRYCGQRASGDTCAHCGGPTK